LKVGSHTLSVVFTPTSPNYTIAQKSVVVTVVNGKRDKSGNLMKILR
jgi:hypothetical protein